MLILAVCDYLGIDPDRVLSYREYPEAGEIAVVIDRGKDGCPKYVIPLDDLPRPKTNDSKPDEAKPEPIINITPKARELANEYAIDVAAISGTGKDGKITVADVKAVIE